MLGGADKQAIVILADGARADIFAELLAAGELPEIQRHIVERGSYRTATSTFTSTTIPAHLPFLTGRFAASANVPGYRWFDPGRQPAFAPLGPWSFRSYNGPEAARVNNDIDPAAKTLFELAPGSINVFGAISRGVGKGDNLAPLRKSLLWMRAHFFGDYRRPDDAARRALVGSLDRFAPFRFAVLPGIDWSSHYIDPFGDATREAYRRADRTVGEVAQALKQNGRYQDTLLAVVSDHGHEPVHEHFDIGPQIARRFGVKVAYHSLRAYRLRPHVVSAVSGNGMAHLYLRRPLDGLVEWLIDKPAVDIVAEREPSGSILVSSRRGRARLAERGDELSYELLRADPFGYPPLPERLDHETALTATADTGHPDGLLQLAQVFRSRRSGDVVVSAAPGYDLRDRFERPEHHSSHGALHATHMNVPLAVSCELEPGPLRTVDVFDIVVDHLGVTAPAGTDGRLRSCRMRPIKSHAP